MSDIYLYTVEPTFQTWLEGVIYHADLIAAIMLLAGLAGPSPFSREDDES